MAQSVGNKTENIHSLNKVCIFPTSRPAAEGLVSAEVLCKCVIQIYNSVDSVDSVDLAAAQLGSANIIADRTGEILQPPAAAAPCDTNHRHNYRNFP